MTDQQAPPPIGSADYWEDVDDEFTVADWKHQVADDNTRMGYHAWALTNRAFASEAGVEVVAEEERQP